MTDWDMTVDALIVGSGGAALTAALVARARGLDVLVAEKTEFIGGSTAMSGGGVWIPASPPMLAAGEADSEAEGLAYMNAVIGDDTGPESSPERRSLWAQKVKPLHVWDVPEDDLLVLYSEMEWTAKATGKTVTFPAVELLFYTDEKISKVEMFLQATQIILDTLEP